MMSIRVDLSAIVDGMEMQSDEMTSFLHRPTGRVVTIRDEAFRAAEDEEEEEEEWVEPKDWLTRAASWRPRTSMLRSRIASRSMNIG